MRTDYSLKKSSRWMKELNKKKCFCNFFFSRENSSTISIVIEKSLIFYFLLTKTIINYFVKKKTKTIISHFVKKIKLKQLLIKV
jgi:hypothetical protein